MTGTAKVQISERWQTPSQQAIWRSDTKGEQLSDGYRAFALRYAARRRRTLGRTGSSPRRAS